MDRPITSETRHDDELEWDWNSPVARGLIVTGGALFAAILGALLGGAMSL